MSTPLAQARDQFPEGLVEVDLHEATASVQLDDSLYPLPAVYGAAYVFIRAGSTWSQQAYLKPSNGETQDSFGVQVAISDDGATLLVGTLDEDCKATGVNAAGCDYDWRDDLSMGAA